MNFLHHPKIITLIGVCFQPMSMVLEFMELGDLRNFIDSHPDLPWPLRIRLLSDVADVKISKTPNNINRENVERRVVVQHNVEGRPLSEVVADVERVLEPIREKLEGQPGAYAVRISGQFEAQEEASRLILTLSLASLAGMLLILYMHFRSTRLALLVLASRPIAFIGAVTYVVVTGQVVSIATLVGMIALLGVSARNAILLVDHYLHLMREDGMSFGRDLIVRAGQERMVPILMTALTSGIGLVPLALGPGQPGREILYPVATVIIGGLISSTLLDFLVTPGLFWLFGREESERVVREQMQVVDESTEKIAGALLGRAAGEMPSESHGVPQPNGG